MTAPFNPNIIPRVLNFKSKIELKKTPNKTGSFENKQ